MTPGSGRVSPADLDGLRTAFQPLIGTQFTEVLGLPVRALEAFEPSQIGTIVGSLMDALIPNLDSIPQVGLTKHEGIVGEREAYPDYRHVSGFRVELKLLYVDNPDLKMKRPPTRREPSARVTQKVTVKNVDPALDAMLLIAYQMRPQGQHPNIVSPTIVDLEVLSMIDLVEARDKRMAECGGRWFGNYETPTILSRVGRRKVSEGARLDARSYGRKESEGKDFNEDTNFGKLQRIPHPPLQAFLRKHHFVTTDEEACDQ
jgi:hypothetical protein